MIDRETLKRITPKALRPPLSEIYWWWHNRGRHTVARALHPRWRESRARLRAFRDHHRGERCFILGNGPSLRRTDLTFLEGEVTFGLNRIYLLFPELQFPTTYLVSVNELVLEQCADEMRTLTIPKFITWRARRHFLDDPRTIFIDSDYTGPEDFATRATGRVFEGHTVTYVAMQLAYHMGFQEVVLIGVDHSFQSKGTANATVISQGADPNHFDPDYFGKGFRWQLPDLEGSERAYRLAREAFEADGRRVLDATIDGQLTVFPKVKYGDLFSQNG